jgi:hypothetical protein
MNLPLLELGRAKLIHLTRQRIVREPADFQDLNLGISHD